MPSCLPPAMAADHASPFTTIRSSCELWPEGGWSADQRIFPVSAESPHCFRSPPEKSTTSSETTRFGENADGIDARRETGSEAHTSSPVSLLSATTLSPLCRYTRAVSAARAIGATADRASHSTLPVGASTARIRRSPSSHG